MILIAIITQTFGSALLSRGMKEVGETVTKLEISQVTGFTRHLINLVGYFHADWARYGAYPVVTLTNMDFLGGLLLQIAFFVIFLTLLSKADLSYVLPVTSFSYVLTAIVAVWMLHEKISGIRWFGTLLICMGVLLVSRGESATTLPTEIKEQNQ